jgi:CHAT domain-containing protein
MNLKKEDIETISEVGTLNGDRVKLLKTWGGLHVLVGKKSKTSKELDTLAAASHKALAIYQVEKEFGNDFQPAIMKSETEQLPQVTELTNEFTPKNLQIYSLAKGGDVDFVVSSHNAILATYKCSIKKSELSLQSYQKQINSNILETEKDNIRKSIAKAMDLYVQKC